MRIKRVKRRRRERNSMILKNIIMAVIVIIISLISYYNTFHLNERTSGSITVGSYVIKSNSEKFI